jgi:hypothetical protein
MSGRFDVKPARLLGASRPNLGIGGFPVGAREYADGGGPGGIRAVERCAPRPT